MADCRLAASKPVRLDEMAAFPESQKRTDGNVHLPSIPDQLRRSRLLYVLLGALVTATGLLWRSGLLPLSSFVSKYGGDALWALLVFVGFGFLFPRASTLRITVISFCFAWAIEFSQLYHAPWLDSIRSTKPGHLVLGSTFNAPDLLAYALGILLGALAENTYRSSLPLNSN